MKAKPIAYPNLLETMNSLVDAHVAIHDGVAEHAQTHHEKMEAHRRDLDIRREAHRLMTQQTTDTNATNGGQHGQVH